MVEQHNHGLVSPEEYESFLGCEIPDRVEIHPPTDVRSKGRCKRSKELPKLCKGKN